MTHNGQMLQFKLEKNRFSVMSDTQTSKVPYKFFPNKTVVYNIAGKTILLKRLACRVLFNFIYHKEVRTSSGYETENYGRILAWNIIAWAYLKWGNLRLEQSGGWDCRELSRSSTGLWTHHKVHRKQVDPFSCQVVSKTPEMTTQKTSFMMERWKCQASGANMEKKGKLTNRMEAHHGQWCGKHQTTLLIKKKVKITLCY